MDRCTVKLFQVLRLSAASRVLNLIKHSCSFIKHQIKSLHDLGSFPLIKQTLSRFQMLSWREGKQNRNYSVCMQIHCKKKRLKAPVTRQNIILQINGTTQRVPLTRNFSAHFKDIKTNFQVFQSQLTYSWNYYGLPVLFIIYLPRPIISLVFIVDFSLQLR